MNIILLLYINDVKELMSQLTERRPERPLTAVRAALQAVEATANRDPDHLRVSPWDIFVHIFI